MGGTHRFNNRRDLEVRLGLPSACVSMGKKYTLYSKTKEDDQWSSITFDLTKLPDELTDLNIYDTIVDGPKQTQLPDFIKTYDVEGLNVSELKSGLFIVIEELDS